MDLLTAERTLLTNSFKAFVKRFWTVVTPFPLVWGRHMDAICDHLQAVRVVPGKPGPYIKNLLINLPPRHSKSILCTVLWPIWMWLSNPAEAILSASYGMELTTKHSGMSRKLVECDDFRRLFPWAVLEEDNNTKTTFRTSAGGSFKAVSVGSGTTGHDSTIVIVDDLHNIKKRESEAERTAAIDYYRNDLSSRGVLGQSVRTVVLGQRVHACDVSGFVIDNYRDHPDWSFLTLPMEFDPDREPLPNVLGFTDWRTERGELLFPEAVTPAMLADFKIKHRHEYPCLFNQDVVNAAGDLFKAEWFKEYRTVNDNYELGSRVVRPGSCVRVAAVDIAVATGGGNDWTVIVIADLSGGDIIVRHVHRERLDGVRFGPTVKALYDTYRPSVVSVEQAGQQKIYVDQLRAAGLPVRAVKVTTDKVDRSVTLQVKMEAGQVWFPAGASWFPDLQSEMLAFPRGRHDDQVDALGMIAGMGRYAGRVEESEEVREARRVKAEADHWKNMLFAGLDF